MTLVKATIKTEITALIAELNTGDPTAKTALETNDAFADGLADIVINAIKAATVTIPPGTIVTVGSPTTQTQSVPGVVNNGLS